MSLSSWVGGGDYLSFPSAATSWTQPDWQGISLAACEADAGDMKISPASAVTAYQKFPDTDLIASPAPVIFVAPRLS